MELIKIPVNTLKEMNSRGFIEITPYIHNPVVKWLFWKRLRTALNYTEKEKKERVLDFGAGSGVFMRTLSRNFQEVHSLDLRTDSLEFVKEKFNLKNVKIKRALRNKPLPYKKEYFDVIFATDVLEHFQNSEYVQKEFLRVLKKGGVLVVSGPTENLLYRLGRKYLYKRKKPKDHYTDVEAILDISKKFFYVERIKILPTAIIPAFKIYKARKR